MEKQRRWQRWLIFAVIVLTVYNILPTVFFYTKPLKQPIGADRAREISLDISKRVNHLEQDSIQWLHSFCKELTIKPLAVKLDPQNPQLISLTFKSAKEANQFRHYLPRAGALIGVISEQLSLFDSPQDKESKTVLVQRRIPIHFNLEKPEDYFQFSFIKDAQGAPTPLWRALVEDRLLQIGMTLGGPSQNAVYLQNALSNGAQSQEFLFLVVQNILSFTSTFGENSSIAERYFSSFTQIDSENRAGLVDKLIATIDGARDHLKLERIALQSESQTLQSQGSFLETAKQQKLELLLQREKSLSAAEAIIKKHSRAFAAGKSPLNYVSLGSLLQKMHTEGSKGTLISLEDRNPFITALYVDWDNERIQLFLHPDLLGLKKQLQVTPSQIAIKDQVDQFLYNEIAFDAREAGEKIAPSGEAFEIRLNLLEGSKSFLALRLGGIASARATELSQTLNTLWTPKSADLQRSVFPIVDYETYQTLPLEQKKLALVIYAPATYNKMPAPGFRMSSVYVMAKGLDKILHKFQAAPNSEAAEQFLRDFNSLKDLLQKMGFFGIPGSTFSSNSEYANDFLFEGGDYYQSVISASREDFNALGTKRYALLEFSNVEQRILTENKIGTLQHEDLLKWRDDWRAAQLGIRGTSRFDVPQPTKNAYWDNFKLSLAKYFRGDDHKILHWGLDLSGGKTVQIELRDANNRLVTNEADLKQGINELYNRVNKMGVSEVSIRREGNTITLDFPGSQGLSAGELVKASSMYFHIVNEKFSNLNPALADASSRFLQEVWNEAVVTNQKEAEEINRIAWRHLYGDSMDSNVVQPRSEAAKILYDNGLRLANPLDTSTTSLFNDSISKIAVYRGNDFTEWHGQTHPLLVVFRNYALEGSNLKNVHASYDQSKGNFLAFDIKGGQTLKSGEKITPRDDLYLWTSQFSKEKITGTPNASYSRGNGWRMAVILNGTIISAPTLDSHLRDSAMITGSFSQREVNQLEADLKAGSLSFTPRILSEKNVSPELGSHEKTLGIVAMIIALLLVIGVMVGYYRFGGVVASVAVLFNLLIMWGTLQNLNATLTFATIAGVILTVGMAVDANVLVFERIREEFAITGRIASAVHAGYRKAFSAIIDSNITTIIAALILLNFDSGPIKGFALTLMIGIISSMFTALFLTRFFFAGWVQNPKHKELKMANFIKAAKFDFLRWTKPTIIVTTIAILAGGYFFATQKSSLLGMDFTGGYSLVVELQPKPGVNYRQEVEKALTAQGATAQDFQIRELTPTNHIRLFLSKSMQNTGRPFFGMPIENDLKDINYSYQNNPRIVWIVSALEKNHLQIAPVSLFHLDESWSEVSGQLSDSMRNSALIGLCIALICILLYITVRFEFKYAISATICLAHDVIFTIAAIALLHAMNVPVQIDLNTIAALMTIIGYSLNDTIIVFDRIREDMRLMHKSSFREIINHALNVTLSRTLMTSGTTLLVLIPLVALGGSTIFGFALVMIIGVIFGTLSSLFIAAPLLQYFQQREVEKKQKFPQVVI